MNSTGQNKQTKTRPPTRLFAQLLGKQQQPSQQTHKRTARSAMAERGDSKSIGRSSRNGTVSIVVVEPIATAAAPCRAVPRRAVTSVRSSSSSSSTTTTKETKCQVGPQHPKMWYKQGHRSAFEAKIPVMAGAPEIKATSSSPLRP